jgi:cellobiose phosphorylase
LSGAAAWAYYSLTQYILGIRPEYDGLRIDPCLPAAWKGFKAERRFRGKQVKIEVKNPSGVQKGVREMTLNGQLLSDNLLPADRLRETNLVVVVMG